LNVYAGLPRPHINPTATLAATSLIGALALLLILPTPLPPIRHPLTSRTHP
jgi:hypothetical protein